jgi:hypothetical protein
VYMWLIIALHNLSLFLHGTCLRAYYVKANWLSEQIITAHTGQTAWLSRATSTCSLADDFYVQNECCATARAKRDNYEYSHFFAREKANRREPWDIFLVLLMPCECAQSFKSTEKINWIERQLFAWAVSQKSSGCQLMQKLKRDRLNLI